MRRVEWSEAASAEYLDALAYIAAESPQAAALVGRRIRHAIGRLKYFNSGRQGRVAGTFEKVVARTSYIIAYEVRGDAKGRDVLYILHLIHTSMDWPPGAWPTR